MDNSNQPPQATRENHETLKVSTSSDPHHSPKMLLIGLGAFLIIIIGGGIGYFMGINNQPITDQTPAPTPLPTKASATEGIASPTPDPTANWKTYIDSLYSYTIQYPLGWILNQDKDSEGDARIELVSPTATLLGVSRKAPQLYISITSPFSTSGVAIANTPGGPADPLEVTINGKQQSIPVTGVGGGKEFDFYTFIFPLPGKKISSPRYSEPVSLNVIASYKTIEEGQTISKILSTFQFSP